MKSFDGTGKPFEIKFKGTIKIGMFNGIADMTIPFTAGSEKAVKEAFEKAKELAKTDPTMDADDVRVEYDKV